MAEKDSVIYEVVMPRLGLTMTEAKIIEWLKKEGEWVAKGEILFVIENEKSTVEIEAPTDGHLHIIIPIDVTVSILTPVASLAGGTVGGHHANTLTGTRSGEHPASADTPNTSTMLSTDLTPDTSAPDTLVPASPKARSLAKELNVSLEGIRGSGIRGMVVADDVQRAVTEKPVIKASPVS